MLLPFQSTSPPVNRRIPHPPSAAPAAGGWGIPDSRCVHSVGFVGWPAGGVVEEVARSERPFAAELVSSGGRVPRSTASELPPFSCLQIFGSVRRVKSSPDPEWQRIRSSCLEKKVVRRCIAASTVVQGVGSSDRVVRRLPSCRGAASHPRHRVEQWQRRATGPFWPPARSGSREGPFCIF